MPLPIANIPYVKIDDAPNAEEARHLIIEAKVVWRNAYQPYSKFKVGAAILEHSGRTFVGCNAETANYDGGHGEEGCIQHMVACGFRFPTMIVSVGALEGSEPAVLGSCGKCRQWIWEYASLNDYDTEVVVTHPGIGQVVIVKISDYLPLAFGPRDVGVPLDNYRR